MNLVGSKMIHSSRRLRITGNAELSEIQVSCLKLAANGYRPAEIGRQLQVSEVEIENELASIEKMLGAKNRLHAIGIAVSQGLIGIDSI